MGTEALSKVMRRDIRRAYAPEASEEVLKFISNTKAELAADVQRMRDLANAFNTLAKDADQHLHERLVKLENTTFLQRLRWLVTGTWDR